ncbi:uncharacterized protein [Gossypium hirsutum]|uniref:Reverse transcriptase zinc-binding domain-containing protein n=1 Tax=Gossypium hirsutum TaxID=3635 RepID=A0A1U8JLZ8_GOSHI|nr:uncharacterized protein LOC107908586 [Gossypium hirsutum]
MLKLKPLVPATFQQFANAKVSTSQLWEAIRTRGVKVECQCLLWFPLHIPKHSLIAWMVIFNRLPTRDRLLAFGISIDTCCFFCMDAAEKCDHIFFECSFSRKVWQSILCLCSIYRAVRTCRQELWIQRNKRYFGASFLTEDAVLVQD